MQSSGELVTRLINELFGEKCKSALKAWPLRRIEFPKSRWPFNLAASVTPPAVSAPSLVTRIVSVDETKSSSSTSEHPSKDLAQLPGENISDTPPLASLLRNMLCNRDIKLPQIAAIIFSGQLPKAEQAVIEKKRVFDSPEPAALIASRLRDTVLEPGTLLMARTPIESIENHCEAMLVDRLEMESEETLAALSPITLYTYFCPCSKCTVRLVNFVRARPSVELDVAFDKRYVPDSVESHGMVSDVGNMRLLRAAGASIDYLCGYGTCSHKKQAVRRCKRRRNKPSKFGELGTGRTDRDDFLYRVLHEEKVHGDSENS